MIILGPTGLVDIVILTRIIIKDIIAANNQEIIYVRFNQILQ